MKELEKLNNGTFKILKKIRKTAKGDIVDYSSMESLVDKYLSDFSDIRQDILDELEDKLLFEGYSIHKDF